MSSIRETAEQFFDACETGKGWDGCQAYCHPDATFSAQAEALEGVETLQGYTDWMKGLLTPVPDGHYEVRSFAVDDARQNVAAYGVFRGTHTGPASGVYIQPNCFRLMPSFQILVMWRIRSPSKSITYT